MKRINIWRAKRKQNSGLYMTSMQHYRRTGCTEEQATRNRHNEYTYLTNTISSLGSLRALMEKAKEGGTAEGKIT